MKTSNLIAIKIGFWGNFEFKSYFNLVTNLYSSKFLRGFY